MASVAAMVSALLKYEKFYLDSIEGDEEAIAKYDAMSLEQKYNKVNRHFYGLFNDSKRKIENQESFFKAMYFLEDCNVEYLDFNYDYLDNAIDKFSETLEKLKEKKKQNKDRYIKELQKKLREIETELNALS